MKKLAEVLTALLPHQQRVIDKLKASGGVLAAHAVGSGKTLTSIAAQDQLGLPGDAITPAPLVGNYEKELAKHLGTVPKGVRVRSYERAGREKTVNPNALVTLDEAQRARNTGTQFSQHVLPQIARAKARLLLTGTPVYNQPEDIAPLINTAAGKDVLPTGEDFKARYIGEEKVRPELLDRLRAWALSYDLSGGTRKTITRKKELADKMTGYVDVHKNDGTHFPSRIDEEYKVPMSKAQMGAYSFASGDMPWYLRAKIEAGLPLSKQESSNLNAFQTALRQVSNTPRPYNAEMTEEQEWEASPKLRQMLDHVKSMRAKNPNHRGVIYSNYLDAGLNPLSRALEREGIGHNVFDGSLSEAERRRMVTEYNSGKTPWLLVSGAGSEGLDLKGTRSIQLMEPHWNNSRLNQVIGRGIRYKSHEHLPEAERNVRVMRYLSTLNPGLGGKLLNAVRKEPARSIEEYLVNAAANKDRLAGELAEAMQQASDRGPLKSKRTGAAGPSRK